MAEDRPRVGRSVPPGPADEDVPVPKPARRPLRRDTAQGLAPPDLGGAAKLATTPSTQPAPTTPRTTKTAEPASVPDLPDADTVLHEMFTPPEIPLTLPTAPSAPPAAPDAKLKGDRIVSVGPPPPIPAARTVEEERAATATSLVRVPRAPLSFEPHTVSRSSAPPAAPGNDSRLVLLNEPASARAASYRSLRDNLLAHKLPRVLAVSSAAPNEGKTTCSINLALALAEQPPTRVLLIDGNFFAPTLGSIFGIDATSPVTAEGDAPWLAPYRIAEIARGLSVAALVGKRGEPAPRFDRQWFDTLVGHLAGASYDYLVIDAAALEGAPSVGQLVAIADGALLTVRSGMTTARAFRRAAEQLPKGKALGVALIDAT